MLKLPSNIGRSKIALAVSGGADSMAMTIMSIDAKIDVIVLIVDHKMRSESTAEANWVKEYIEKTLALEVKILTWNKHCDIKSNIQSRAREARYRLLKDECNKMCIKYLCTAHNKNDQAETVLMNIMRGSGINGLTGIQKLSQIEGITILRPILHLDRVAILQFLNDHHANWIEDPSNYNNKYGRVKVRNFITKLENSDLVNAKDFTAKLNLLSINALRTRNFLEQYVDKTIQQICDFTPLQFVMIDAKKFFEEDIEISFRMLRNLLKQYGKVQYTPRLESLEFVYSHLLNAYKVNKGYGITLSKCIIYLCISINNNVILIIRPEQYDDDMQYNCILKVNEVAKLKKIILNSPIEIFDQNLYEAAIKLLRDLPKAHKILRGIRYHNVIQNGVQQRHFYSLGIKYINLV